MLTMSTGIFRITVLILLVSAFSLGAEEQKKYLFILAGQSNMVRLDPEVSLKPMLEFALGKGNVILVKDAEGGRSILRWYGEKKTVENKSSEAPGDLYRRMMGKVDLAIKGESIKTIIFIWMQGESDARKSYGEAYEQRLRGLIDRLSADLGDAHISFVIGRLSDFGLDNPRYPHWRMVRKAQMEVAETDPCGAWVNTDDLNDRQDEEGRRVDDLHYTAEGFRILGIRFAEKALQLIKRCTYTKSALPN